MTTDNSPAHEDDLPEQLRIRREKRASLIERGIEPYPVAVARTKSLKEVLQVELSAPHSVRQAACMPEPFLIPSCFEPLL